MMHVLILKVNGHLECAYLHGVELHSVLGSSHTTPLTHTISRLCACTEYTLFFITGSTNLRSCTCT